jgi:DNA-binding MarR family transcriptional regulator
MSGAATRITDVAVDPADLAARFRQALTPLTRQLRTQVEGDMTPSLMSALGTVAREGPIALGDLAAAERVTPPMATKLANGLEERGLVRRVGCTDDKRVTRLELAPAGRTLLDRSHTRRNAWLARRFADLDDAERAALAAAVEVIERLNREGTRP